jgi:pimeloyl-ACP methyl ester carboxylesterase
VDSFFFGESQRALYGCFHLAPSALERDAVAVLVPPLGQESIRCHRTYRLLADRLAGSGLSCLRFDLYGTGHSAGEDVECSVATSLECIGYAISDARRRALTDRVALIGARFGATLAALYGTRVGRADVLALWDPVVDGRRYLQDLAAAHENLTRKPARPLPNGVTQSCELIGFDYSRVLIDELAQVDLRMLTSAPGDIALLVESARFRDGQHVSEVLERLGVPVTRRPTSDLPVWDRTTVKSVVASGVIAAIDEWLGVVTT